MTDQQQVIALEAIARKPAPTYELIHEEVAVITGISVERVTETIQLLVHEGILKQCVTPARKVAEDPTPPEVRWAWYEKGEWPQMSFRRS